MGMVVPAVVGSSLGAMRFETGPNGNPHWHCLGYGDGNPRLDNVEEAELEQAPEDVGVSTEGRAAASVSVKGDDDGRGDSDKSSEVSSADGSGDDVRAEAAAAQCPALQVQLLLLLQHHVQLVSVRGPQVCQLSDTGAG